MTYEISQANEGDICFSCEHIFKQDEDCIEIESMENEAVCMQCHRRYGLN